MEIKAIRTAGDYLAALREVSALIDLDPTADSPEGENSTYWERLFRPTSASARCPSA